MQSRRGRAARGISSRGRGVEAWRLSAHKRRMLVAARASSAEKKMWPGWKMQSSYVYDTPAAASSDARQQRSEARRMRQKTRGSERALREQLRSRKAIRRVVLWRGRHESGRRAGATG